MAHEKAEAVEAKESKETRDAREEKELAEKKKRADDVGRKVLAMHGTVKNLLRVDSTTVHERAFRVNVIVGEGEGVTSQHRIKHSHFVRVTPDGIVCDPPIPMHSLN